MPLGILRNSVSSLVNKVAEEERVSPKTIWREVLKALDNGLDHTSIGTSSHIPELLLKAAELRIKEKAEITRQQEIYAVV